MLGRHWLLHPLNLLSLGSANVLGPHNLELLSGMGDFCKGKKKSAVQCKGLVVELTLQIIEFFCGTKGCFFLLASVGFQDNQTSTTFPFAEVPLQ